MKSTNEDQNGKDPLQRAPWLDVEESKKDLKGFLDLVAKFMEAMVPEEGALAKIARSLIKNRGKMLRPAFVFLGGGAVTTSEIVAAGATFELFHLASLVHDDIVDETKVRRNEPSVYAAHGTAMALYVGDYLISLALHSLTLQDLPSQKLTLENLMVPLLEAEVDQYHHRFDRHQDLTDYEKRLAGKTGILFAQPLSFGAYLRGASADCQKALFQGGLLFGQAFQLRDDLQDLFITLRQDLAQGQYSYPILLAAKTSPKVATLLDEAKEAFELKGRHPTTSLKKDSLGDDYYRELLVALKDSGAIDLCRKKIRALLDQGGKILKKELPEQSFKIYERLERGIFDHEEEGLC